MQDSTKGEGARAMRCGGKRQVGGARTKVRCLTTTGGGEGGRGDGGTGGGYRGGDLPNTARAPLSPHAHSTGRHQGCLCQSSRCPLARRKLAAAPPRAGRSRGTPASSGSPQTSRLQCTGPAGHVQQHFERGRNHIHWLRPPRGQLGQRPLEETCTKKPARPACSHAFEHRADAAYRSSQRTGR